MDVLRTGSSRAPEGYRSAQDDKITVILRSAVTKNPGCRGTCFRQPAVLRTGSFASLRMTGASCHSEERERRRIPDVGGRVRRLGGLTDGIPLYARGPRVPRRGQIRDRCQRQGEGADLRRRVGAEGCPHGRRAATISTSGQVADAQDDRVTLSMTGTAHPPFPPASLSFAGFSFKYKNYL